jgi:hypothetical protein
MPMTDIVNDLRAVQKTTVDSDTALLLESAGSEIEALRHKHETMLQRQQHMLLNVNAYLNGNFNKEHLEKLILLSRPVRSSAEPS